MKKRDAKGRFSKDDGDESNNLILTIPTFTTILKWITITLVLFPWIIIISKFNIFQKLEIIFDILYKERNEENADNVENGKKSGLFY